MESLFETPYEQLPAEIPIFPLPGALLLPRGRLPLNLFEPRYLNMALDALKAERIIGMIQPLEYQPDPVPADAVLYHTGCAGRIVSFSETEDGRILITLKGLIRFDVADELESQGGYRRIRADYAPHRADLINGENSGEIPRDELMALLKRYLDLMGIRVDWDAIQHTDDAFLVTSLAMTCPFQVGEKQALLEAGDLGGICRTLIQLMDMAVRSGGENSAKH